MEKKFIYNHPSIPRKGIVLEALYSINDLKGIYTEDEIKHFFKEKVEEVKVEENKNNKKNK